MHRNPQSIDFLKVFNNTGLIRFSNSVFSANTAWVFSLTVYKERFTVVEKNSNGKIPILILVYHFTKCGKPETVFNWFISLLDIMSLLNDVFDFYPQILIHNFFTSGDKIDWGIFFLTIRIEDGLSENFKKSWKHWFFSKFKLIIPTNLMFDFFHQCPVKSFTFKEDKKVL